MKQAQNNKWIGLAIILFMGLSQRTYAEDFLPAKEAFKVSAQAISTNTIEVTYQIAPKYYLYQERLKFDPATPGETWGQALLPKSIAHYDTNFQKTMNIYRNTFSVKLSTHGQPKAIKLGYQGCADAGLCYPPQSVILPISWPSNSKK